MNGWRPALRIARRNLRRNVGRSVLIAVLVAVPVAGATLVDVLYRTVTTGEREAARNMGSADAVITVTGSASLPGYRPGPWGASFDPAAKPDRDPDAVDLPALLPAGTRLARSPLRYDFAFEADERFARASLVVADPNEPLHRHEARMLEGRAPSRPDEVVLSPGLADRLGVAPGDRVGATVRNPETRATEEMDLTVAGLAEARYCLQCEDAMAGPGSLAAEAAVRTTPDMMPSGGVDYLVDLPAGAAPAEDLWPALAEQGVALTPRDAFVHPERYEEGGGSSVSADDLRAAAMSTLIAGLGLLEVVLLAGTAFAVGARRQTRELGLVAASGGAAHHVRRIVLAQGLVLGVIGAVLGVAAGFLLAFAGRPLWESMDGGRIDGWAFGPWEIVGAALIGVLSGLGAAIVPAIGAGRMRAVDALAERFRVKRSTRRRSAALGGILVAVGAVLGLVGDRMFADDLAAYSRLLATAAESGAYVPAPSAGRPIALIVFGATLLVAGLLLLTPAAIGALAGIAARLPLSPRLAVRDAARHRHRTGPATSAIGIAVAGSVVLAFLVAGSLRAEELRYIPSVPDNMLSIDRGNADDAGLDRAAAHATAELPGTEVHRLRVPLSPAAEGDASLDPSARMIYLAADPAACSMGCVTGNPVIAGDQALNEVAAAGPLDAAARRALADGRVVVLQPAVYHPGGHVVVEGHTETDRVELPAYLVPRDVVYTSLPSALIPESVAREQGWEVARGPVLVSYDAAATPDQVDRAISEADRLGAFAQVERGPGGPEDAVLLMFAVVAGLVTLIGVAISVALSAAEGRADLATLAAVGAPPRRRRSLAAAQALLISGLGCSLGVGFGAFVAFTARATTGAPTFIVPWPNLAVTMVAVPLLAVAVAAFFTPSRLPLVRRAT